MASLTNLELPPPGNWQDFESLCRDLWQRTWDDPDTQKNGRVGQPQAGVDIFGRPGRGARWAGVQCKLKSPAAGEALSETAIHEEVSRARKFRPSLDSFILATTACRDARAQELARRITEEHVGRGEFSVAVFAWEDIVQELARHEDLVALHFPQFTLRTAGGSRGLTLPPPKLPPHYLARPGHLAGLKVKLLAAGESRIGITGQGTVGVQGMGGIGKTVLAAAVAADEEVLQAFSDGVYWLSVGQEPDLVDLLRQAAQALGDRTASFTEAAPAKSAVRALLAGRKALLVLDDVWTLGAAESLDVTSGESRTLLTSRNAEVMIGLGATEHCVDVLAWEQALDLLASWAGCGVAELPGEARDVAAECGCLPLALAMVGAMVRLRPAAWRDALELFRDADLEALRLAFPSYPYPDLLRAIEVSVHCLEPWQRERYLELAVFAEEVAIPEPVLVMLWSASGLKARAARGLAGTLVSRALARYDEQGRLTLHDLQRDYVRARASELPALHRRLVEAYRAACGNGFAGGPDDGYYFQWLPRHLRAAGLGEELRALLFDFRWLEAKLRAAGIGALIQDLDLAEKDSELQHLRQQLRLSAHILTKEPAELASQFLGRLQPSEGPGVALLLRSIDRPGIWLRPRQPSLSGLGPRGFLERTFEEFESVDALVKLADWQVFAASVGKPLRHIDLETGRVVRAFEGHVGIVTSLALLDSRYLISTSGDGRIRIWSLETGALECTLEGAPDTSLLDTFSAVPGHVVQTVEDRIEVRSKVDGKIAASFQFGPPAIAASVLLEGHRLVVAAQKPHLTVWDLDGRRILSQHSCAASPRLLKSLDTQRFAVGLQDGTVQIWSAETLQPLFSLDEPRERRADRLEGLVTLEPRGERLLLAAEASGQIQVWDTEERRLVRVIALEHQPLEALVALGDLALCSVRFGDLSLVDLDRGETLCSWPAHFNSARPLLALDSRRVVSAAVDGLRIWNLSEARGAVAASRPPIQGLRRTARGVAAVTCDGGIGRLDVASGKLGACLQVHPGGLVGMAVLADGRIITASKEDGIAVTDLDAGRVDHRFEIDCSSVRGIEVLPGERVVAYCEDGALRIIAWSRRELERRIRVHSEWLASTVVLGDRTLIVGLNNGELRILDWTTGKTIGFLSGPGDYAPTLCKLGRHRVVCAAGEGGLRAWDLQPGFRHGRLLWSSDQGGFVYAICSLDTARFVTASSDCTLRVWNVETGLLETTLSTDAPVWRLLYLPDQRALVAADSQHDVHVLDFVHGRDHLSFRESGVPEQREKQ